MGLVGTGLTAALVAVAAFVVNLMYDAGELAWNRPHGAGRCRLALRAELVGVEDAAVDHEAGVAYLAWDDRFEAMERGDYLESDASGGVWRYDFGTGEAAPVELRGGPATVHPHGVDVRGGLLALTDHQPGFDRVLVFRLADGGGAADFVREVRGGAVFTGINDVALRDDGSFFVSNWLSQHPKSFLGAVEKYGQRPWTTLVHCGASGGGEDCRVVDRGFKMANGVLVAPDDRTVWLVETIGKQLHEYEAAADGSLTKRRVVPTNKFLGDNLAYNPNTRELRVAAHPRGLHFAMYARKPRTHGGSHSPWAVLRLDEGADAFVEELYSTGEVFSGASVAAKHGARTVVGSVFDRGVFVCDDGLDA